MKLLVLFGLLPAVFCAGETMGGKSNVSYPEESAEVMAVARFAVEKLNGILGVFGQIKMTDHVKILSAQTQVVSGVNYFLTLTIGTGTHFIECNVVVYDQPWTNTKQLKSQNCVNQQASKRSFLGGIVPAGMDADTKKAISFGIENFNQRSNSMFRSQPLKISNVSKQLVAGNLYTFDADMQETQCRKNQDNMNKGFADCPPNVKGLRNVCKFTVLQQEWNTPEWTLTDFKCNQGGLLGGDGHDLCHLDHFTKFKTDFNKNYETTQEEKKRFKVFCDNMEIARRIQDVEKGTAKYGPTIFADMAGTVLILLDDHMDDEEEAKSAIEGLNGYNIRGLRIRVEESRPPSTHGGSNGVAANNGYDSYRPLRSSGGSGYGEESGRAYGPGTPGNSQSDLQTDPIFF